MTEMKITVLGLGNLGSAVAQMLANNGHQVLCWEHDAAVVTEVNAAHANSRYLPGIELHASIRATNNISEALAFPELLFNCLPSRFVGTVLEAMAASLPMNVPVVNMAKGLHPFTRQTVMQMLAEHLPRHPLAMLCGPSLANEFVRGVNTVLVCASADQKLSMQVQNVLESERMTVLFSNDIVGVELCSILKNAYAIGMGIASSTGRPGLNFAGAYLVQALCEMQHIGKALGAMHESFYGFAGLGDLVATAMSETSHNHTCGRLLGEGLGLSQVEQKMGLLPEGVNTLHVMLKLAGDRGIALPLAQLLQQVLDEHLTAEQFHQRFNGCLR